LGIDDQVAVDIDERAAGRVVADLRPAIDREAGDKVAARQTIACREQRDAEGLSRVALAVELIARRIDNVLRVHD
jgi:hypothetical protein